MSAPTITQVPELAGYTVAVTAARRREELGSLFERRGARVIYAPAIRIVPLADDAELVATTRRCLAKRPDVVVATTGIGFRGWVEAADGWGIGDELLDVLGGVRLLARGPKARGAIRAAGLREEWSPESESSSEVLEHLLEEDLKGLRIVVQLHGEPVTDLLDTLRMAGADVESVPVYRWLPPEDVAPLHRLLDALLEGSVDCVTFTSAPAAACLLQIADQRGDGEAVVRALREDVLVASVGPITAGPLQRVGVDSVIPERARLGALAREVTKRLPECSPTLMVAGHTVQARGHAVVVDGGVRPVAPAPMALLHLLAGRPGAVVSRSELGRAMPGGQADDHAVGMTVNRLRTALGDPRIVQTVVKRGFRLAYEPEIAPPPKPRPASISPFLDDEPEPWPTHG